MGIGKKLTIVRVLFLIVILMFSTYSYFAFAAVQKDFEQLRQVTLEDIYTSSDLKARIGVQGVHLRQYVLQANESSLEMLGDEQAALEQLTNALTINEDATSKGIIEALDAGRIQFNETAKQVMALADNGEKEQAIAMLGTEIRAANLVLNEESTNLLNYYKEQYDVTSKAVDEQVGTALITFTLLLVFSFIVSIVIGISMKKLIIRPLNQVEQEISKIASGDITGERLTIKNRDEIGKLADAFNALQGATKAMIVETKSNATDFSIISTQLTSNVQSVLETAEEVAQNAASITQSTAHAAQIAKDTTVAMEHTTEAVQSIADTTENFQQKAQHTTDIAKSGDVTIREVQQQMDAIYASTKQTASLVNSLSQSSTEIRHITQVISDLTDQTNLLALNAAIEAARAGEHGAGFAVVADEVRKLAEQSKTSAASIEQLTTTILAETKEVEQAISGSIAQVELGVEKITQAGRAFNDITTAVDDIVGDIAEVSAVAEQISVTSQQVSASVSDLTASISHAASATEDISQQVEEQVASVEEVSTVSNNINDKSNELVTLVKDYKI